MKIGVTGDIHGDLSFKRIYEAKKLGIKVLVVTGDFGYIWSGDAKEQKQLNYLNKIGVKVLFCDGNHESFNVLNSYPISEMYGGRVHKIRDNIIHLMRGEIYNIDNKSFFVFGGANSTDKEHRKEGKSWWKEELPSSTEKGYGLYNLNAHGNKVDYIITHTCPSSILKLMDRTYRIDELTNFLETIKSTINFHQWYFGHMHENKSFHNTKINCLYSDIYEIKEKCNE